MKKILLMAVAAFALFGCNKNNTVDNSQKPSVAWEANASFDEMEIATDMDARVVFTVPEGVSSLKITLSIPATLIGVANKLIGTTSNKGTASRAPILDLVNDATAVSALKRIGFFPGATPDATFFSMDFTKLLNELAGDSVLDNASKFSFAISLVDKADNSLSKTVRFNWTSGPEITTIPEGKIDLNSESPSLIMNIKAPGKIEKASITFSNLAGAPGQNEGILAYIKSFTKDGYAVDLIENPSVAKALGLPSGSDVKDKTELTIDFSSLFFALAIQACEKDEETSMKIELSDALGKYTRGYVILVH